jgi:ribonuclease T2
MKQYEVGLTFGALALALGAYFVFAAPVAPPLSPVPRGKGFDFYVLALSWSPTYCQDRQAQQRDAVQCSGPRPFAFVVHGLWPQFERGYPRSCQTNQRRPSLSDARALLDIMPSERLVQHEWDNHGACSGLTSRDYLKVVRQAARVVQIPAAYASATDWRRVTAGDVEAEFIAANPDLSPTGIAIAKRGNNLSEVRICLTLDLQPRPCLEVDQDGVRDATRLSLPPSRALLPSRGQ